MQFKTYILITLSLLLFCLKSNAQLATPPGPDLQEKAAGFELVKASRHFYTGAVIIGGGTVIEVIGAVSQLQGNRSGGGIELLGDLAVLTGAVFMIESFSHIGRAGKILMQRNDMTLGSTPHGVGLSVHF